MKTSILVIFVFLSGFASGAVETVAEDFKYISSNLRTNPWFFDDNEELSNYEQYINRFSKQGDLLQVLSSIDKVCVVNSDSSCALSLNDGYGGKLYLLGEEADFVSVFTYGSPERTIIYYWEEQRVSKLYDSFGEVNHCKAPNKFALRFVSEITKDNRLNTYILKEAGNVRTERIDSISLTLDQSSCEIKMVTTEQ